MKETFSPRSLSTALIALRFASSVSTAIVRNEVAVGTARLSSIALASIAAGPRSCFASPAEAAAAAAPLPPPSAAASTSSLVTFDPGPVPLTEARSTPVASATLRATGVALTSAAPLPPPFEPWEPADASAAGGAEGELSGG